MDADAVGEDLLGEAVVFAHVGQAVGEVHFGEPVAGLAGNTRIQYLSGAANWAMDGRPLTLDELRRGTPRY